MGQVCRSRLRIVQHQPARHGPAAVPVRVIDAVDPIVGPLAFFHLRLAERILPQRRRIFSPGGGDGGVAGGGRQRVEVGLRGRPEAVQRIDVNEDRADHLVPLLARGDIARGAAAVMGAAPVIQDDRVRISVVAEMAVQFLLRGAAAEVFDRRVDEPDADMVPGARPAVRRHLVLHGGVAVLVLHGILVVARAHDALFLRVDDDPRAPVEGRAFEQVAVRVHREPVEGLVQDGDEAALRHVERAVRFGVRIDRVDVKAAFAASQGIADLEVAIDHAAARPAGRAGRQPRGRVPLGDALYGNLGALASVRGRVDGEGLRQPADFRRGRWVFLPDAPSPTLIMAHRLGALVEKGLQVARALVDAGGHDAVVQRERLVVLRDGHRRIFGGLRDDGAGADTRLEAAGEERQGEHEQASGEEGKAGFHRWESTARRRRPGI